MDPRLGITLKALEDVSPANQSCTPELTLPVPQRNRMTRLGEPAAQCALRRAREPSSDLQAAQRWPAPCSALRARFPRSPPLRGEPEDGEPGGAGSPSSLEHSAPWRVFPRCLLALGRSAWHFARGLTSLAFHCRTLPKQKQSLFWALKWPQVLPGLTPQFAARSISLLEREISVQSCDFQPLWPSRCASGIVKACDTYLFS